MQFVVIGLFVALISSVSAIRSAFDHDLYESVINEEECARQLNFLRTNSLGLQFLDASAKIPSGIFSGNLNDFGDYHQCLGIDQYVNNMDVKGKYCAVAIPLDQEIQLPEWPQFPDFDNGTWPWPWPNPDNITWPWPTPDNDNMETYRDYSNMKSMAQMLAGVVEKSNDSRIFPVVVMAQLGGTAAFCIPKVCPTRQAIDFIQNTTLVQFKYREFFCRLPNDKPLAPADYVAISFLSIVGLLLVASTAYDLCYKFYFKREANSLYRCFSVYTNTRRFLTFNSPPGALECVDGIRAISMAWVIVGHTYSMTLLGYVHNIQETLVWLRKFSSFWVNAAPITVDTFFMLSGILVVYTVVGKITRSRFIRTIHLFYLNRFLRMFPLLATVVLLQASLFNHLSDGPFWHNVGTAVENCRRHWWSTLLHVQNYVNTLDLCLAQTWYLSVDMQLYIVCPIVLVCLFSHKKFAWTALTFFLLLSLTSSTIYSFMYNYSAALLNPDRIAQFNDYVRHYYVNTLTRAPPFFVGMVYGYLLHLWRDKKVRISKLTLATLWVLSFAIMAYCIFAIYPVMQLDHDAQLFDNFLNAYMRAMWACGLGWLIFACVKGYGGPINWFLSLRMWKLPARLSYAMYLIHLPIIMVANGSWVKTHYFSNGDSIYRFMSDITISFLAALVLCIAIDAPFSTIQKLMLGGGRKKTPQKKSELKDTVIEAHHTNL